MNSRNAVLMDEADAAATLQDADELDSLPTTEDIEALLHPEWRLEFAAALMIERSKEAIQAKYNRLGNHAARNSQAETQWRETELVALGAIAALRREHKGVTALFTEISRLQAVETRRQRADKEAKGATFGQPMFGATNL